MQLAKKIDEPAPQPTVAPFDRDDALRPPLNKFEHARRMKLAQAYLDRNPHYTAKETSGREIIGAKE
jgi:hypothetical protein